MTAAVIVAVIALAGTLGNIVLTYFLNVRSEQRIKRQKADAAWRKYLDAHRFACEQLASRLDNILNDSFLNEYGPGTEHNEEAVLSTLFRFASYLGWTEILRREMRQPVPGRTDEEQELRDLSAKVGKKLATDKRGYGKDLMLWREAQLAIGELMIVDVDGVSDTIGVSEFFRDYGPTFKFWFSRMAELLRNQPFAVWPAGALSRLADIDADLRTFIERI